MHINLENGLVGKDVAAFVSHRLKSVVNDNENLRRSLQSTICSRSQGLFLYARLLLDQTTPSLEQQQPLDVNELARTLPVGLEDMYHNAVSTS